MQLDKKQFQKIQYYIDKEIEKWEIVLENDITFYHEYDKTEYKILWKLKQILNAIDKEIKVKITGRK